MKDKRQRYGAILLFAIVGMLLVWIARNSSQMPPAVPSTHYNTGALLKKDGSGCVNAAEQSVPCPPGTITADAAAAPTGSAFGRIKIPSANASSPAGGTKKSPIVNAGK